MMSSKSNRIRTSLQKSLSVLSLCAVVLIVALTESHTQTLQPLGMGDNSSYQTNAFASQLPFPRKAATTDTFTDIAGKAHGLAVKSDGTVVAWGENGNGQLGDGSVIDRYAPVQVSGLTNVIRIAAGVSHSVALKLDGTVWAWGNNTYGQLGDGANTNRSAPFQVFSLTGVSEIEAGDIHSVALKSDGTVVAWGGNANGQLGNGTTTNSSITVSTGLTGVSQIAAGAFHNLALKSDGTVMAWGYNGNGALGDSTVTQRTSPVATTGLPATIAGIAAGGRHSLAYTTAGALWAWGLNSSGQLGDGTTTQRLSPVAITNAIPVRRVYAGNAYSMLLQDSATISGTLTLQGLAATAPAQPVTLEFRDANKDVLYARSVSVGASGAYSLTVPQDVYTVHLSATRYLGKNVTVTATGSTITLNVTVKAGDANADNVADISDLLLLIAHYNAVSSGGNYLEACDFNRDGNDDISDLLLLISNYNQIGDN